MEEAIRPKVCFPRCPQKLLYLEVLSVEGNTESSPFLQEEALPDFLFFSNSRSF